MLNMITRVVDGTASRSSQSIGCGVNEGGGRSEPADASAAAAAVASVDDDAACRRRGMAWRTSNGVSLAPSRLMR
jgi:hypothetical protein